MNQLQQAATRERRAPIFWWLMMMVATGGALVVMVHSLSRSTALFLAVMLVAAWVAPMVAQHSLVAPRRAKRPPPRPGEGSHGEWREQANLLGRVLLYYGENRDLPPGMRQEIQAARGDLHDTLKSHPLRDDLERVCQRIREGALRKMKDWYWLEYSHRIREILREYERETGATADEDERLLALQAAVENAAAAMARSCMSRMLERERLICAQNCAWLASQCAQGRSGTVSPIELAAMLVIEWSDFSEPWQPARMLQRAMARLREGQLPAAEPALAADAAAEAAPAPKKYRRVRVRIRRKRYRHPRPYRGPSILDVLLSFGQWVRYSVRAWTLYR